MTPLEEAVVRTMAAHNSEQRPEDPPYPWSLLPMARAVIEVLRRPWEHIPSTELPTGGIGLTEEESDSFWRAMGYDS